MDKQAIEKRIQAASEGIKSARMYVMFPEVRQELRLAQANLALALTYLRDSNPSEKVNG
jgi:hypothetical protein